jgi:hypothetical protein
MTLCPCGNAAEENSALCDRCAALQLFELKPGATAEEIKAAYLLLVKVWHPDRFPGDKKLNEAAEKKLKAINSAYRLLASTPGKPSPGRRPQRPSSRRAQQRPAAEPPQPQGPSVAPRKRPGLPTNLATFVAMTVVQRLVVVACGIGVSGLFLKFVDSEMASDPSTAGVYAEYRSAMATELAEPKRRLWDQVEEGLHKLSPTKPTPIPPAVNAPIAQGATATLATTPLPSAVRPAAKSAPRQVRLLPFITVGLTKDEVLAIAGAPASSTEDTFLYKGSEVTFKDGKVTGWKIDPVTSPLRVKLWPDAPVDTSLQYFSIGSSKNEVLVVQGTPTSFSGDTFGYGRSEVYFEDNRVVRWRNDPSSIPLRTVRP